MNKCIVILFFFILSGCSNKIEYNKNNNLINKYLTDENFIFQIKSRHNQDIEDFFVYRLSYFTIAKPSGNLPKSVTEYLFIKDSIPFDHFELYRYSNYSEPVKLKNVSGDEYKSIVFLITQIKNNESIECRTVQENNLNYGFEFYFNILSFKEIITTSSMLGKQFTETKKYLCLQSYLNSILFIRELNQNTNVIK